MWSIVTRSLCRATAKSSLWHSFPGTFPAKSLAQAAEHRFHKVTSAAELQLSRVRLCYTSFGQHTAVHKLSAKTDCVPVVSGLPLFHNHIGNRLFASQAGNNVKGARMRNSADAFSQARTKSGEQALYLVAVVVGMIGITYASVPLYRMFCQATGFGGTVQRVKTVEEKIRDTTPEKERALASRNLTVEFNADVEDGMPWRFRPTQRSVQIKPGESALAFYTAENTSKRPITGVSTYNVTPQAAGVYFNKIQCFCFEEQKLRAGEKIDMPVFFYIDPEFATDPRLKGVDNLTLSYTFFMVEEGKEYPQLPQPGQPALAMESQQKLQG